MPLPYEMKYYNRPKPKDGDMSDKRKVFKVNDCEWVASVSAEEARSFYLELMGEEEDSGDLYCDLEPQELSDREMNSLKWHDVEGMIGEPKEIYSLKKALQIMVEDCGHVEGESFYFATTEI